MNVGNVLLATAFAVLLGATGILARAYLADDDRHVGYVTMLTGTGAVALAGALAQLTYQFVVTDYSNAYVWNNTADYLPLLYRVTGVYAGNEGSILLWAALTALVAFTAGVIRGFPDRHSKLVHAITFGIVTYFVGMLLLQSPFASIRTEFANAPPGYIPTSGEGLNPLLVDPYMAIHPPVMFVSYALLTMPFAIGAAHFVSLFRGDGSVFAAWRGSVTRWLRVSWLFLTVAVALGGLWSYTVLGWGGIWAWDPVETAILVPWLFLTATVHAVVRYRPNDEYRILAPAMTATVFSLAIYTTSIVRSGTFRSVHSFADGGIGISFIVLMVLTSVLGVVVPLAYWFLQDGEATGSDGAWLTRDNLLHAAVLLFGLLTFVSLWGLSFPVLRAAVTGVEVSVESHYFNLWSYPLVGIALLLLGFYMDFDVEGRRRSLTGLAVFGTAAVAAAFVAPSETWQLSPSPPTQSPIYGVLGSISVLSILPPAAYAILGVTKRALARIPATADRGAMFKETGITAIHVGAVLLVLSLPFMYMFAGQASAMATGIASESVDTSYQDVAGTDYSVRVLDYTSNEFPQNPKPESYALSADQVAARGPSLNGTVQAVYGTVTDIRRGPQATVIQLDNSRTWVGVIQRNETTGNLSVQTGQGLVARGRLMWNFVPNADATVLASPQTIGSPANPPEGVVPTRVQVDGVSLAVYEDGKLVTSGVAGQREYPQQGNMQVRDVLIDRGLVTDTYVIAGVSDGTASMTVKQVPLMSLLRLSIVLLVAGMSTVLVFDPEHGIQTLTASTASSTDVEPETTD
ncbi:MULTISPECIES: cytochrome c biogenesis protein CcsA [Halobacterium]|uniref:cytochrome c biogenesis protein CcsA n=1 Tax=Halobacterium TaxID=2239 RepID=UPI001E56D2A0|nr:MULTISPECIES: cytochrome c biogenesis protein CcsA [Halobacterium]MCD2203926.1 cytochrome c biogenesis protein CcsA [Halobacterium sp. KA-6]UHH26937.1 cytochrome c biogenesis protein CcsA [Halobacterium noricense]